MEREFYDLFATLCPKNIVETGTHKGTGTTTMIWKALQAHQLKARLITIECNPEFYQMARDHFESNGMDIIAWRGLSLPHSKMPEREEIYDTFVKNASDADRIYYDHHPRYRVAFYRAEVDFEGDDDLLRRAIREISPVDFLLLDSAGHLGFAEYEVVQELLDTEPQHFSPNLHVCLDDTRHCKHHRTLCAMKADPRWEIVLESDDRYGFAIARRVN